MLLVFKEKETIEKIDSSLPSEKKIAYFIGCHRNANQINRLMKLIYRTDNLYIINIDKKSPAEFYKAVISSFFSSYENVYFMHNRVDWGGWNQVQVTLDAIKKALSLDNGWTHFINLSGLDFPLKSQEEIQTELSNNLDKSFIEARHHDLKDEQSKILFAFNIMGYKGKNPLRFDLMYPFIKFHKGSQWMILSRAFCNNVLYGKMSKKLIPIFTNAYIPDESFFTTLAANGELSSSIIWENKRFIEWGQETPHPKTFIISDFDCLIASQKYFARKFDETIDSEILTKLEDHLNNKKD